MPLQANHLEHNLLTDDPFAGLGAQADAASAIDAWLAVFARLLRLPESSRQAIRLELREHLRERVRDLLLSRGGGACDERDAVRLAIEELGETVQLARRFEQANRPNRRRLLMNASMLLLGAGVIAAGVIMFNPQAGSPMTARFDEVTRADVAPPPALAQAKITLHAENSLREAVQIVVEQTKLGLTIDWGEIEEAQVDPNAPLGLSIAQMPAPRALDHIARAAADAANPLDWRARDDHMIEFGVKSELDRREIELITYNVAATLDAIAMHFADTHEKAAEQVGELILEMVEPWQWVENGGDLAQMKLVGGRLFVQAPRRTHAKVAWILQQLPRDDEAAARGDAPADRAAAKTPLLGEIPILGELHRQRDDEPEVAGDALNLAPGDVLQLEVFELMKPGEWFHAMRQIETDGVVRFPIIGQFNAAGRSAREIEKEVVARLKETVLAEPVVSVYEWNAASAPPSLSTTLSDASDREVRRVLNPGDRLTVSIFELYQPTVWATAARRVDENGMLRISEVGDVRAAGLTVKQLEAQIARHLKANGFEDSAMVDVVFESP